VPDKPSAEVTITEPIVRALVVGQAAGAVPDAASLPLLKVAEGWDSELWRLGESLAVRLPRRALAAPLVLNEQRTLGSIAARVEPTGLRVPAPVFSGAPGSGFPWAWSIVPWFEGTRGLDVERVARLGWAERLAAGLLALHEPAAPGYPVNPVRGIPLVERDAGVSERMSLLGASGGISDDQLGRARSLWREGVIAPVWSEAPVWIHGDLHPGNLVARGSELVALIDFGDVTAGDPAYDLAVAWLAFDASGREVFRGAIGDRYGKSTWVRARAWAVAVSVLLLSHSDDNPDYARLGGDALAELTSPERPLGH
jgi:aminoglycoside phosphotransferase (APT) family kinase protein